MDKLSSSSENNDVDALADAMGAAALENLSSTLTQPDSAGKPQDSAGSPRPLRIYTRAQLLSLHNSPLVKPPPNMPELKSWFGTENEQNLAKKDTETPASNARERRFRRDYEDGETPARASFRSTLTQPSQMGNFKHQSLRDREKDRDGDKDRERDSRDKEGHERLRHLSDKYDRDRMGMASTVSRNKDRDAAPHLSPNSTRNVQTSGTSASSRRNEPREGTKRKGAESGDDWRRGGSDLTRSNREERSDTGRKDREERERARSRQRETSRPRPEQSRRERAAERDDGRPRDRDREDSRRDRDDDDDPRHWRDDGKRDERIAARRTRERPLGDHWEPSTDRERRWPATEDRDGRSKRTNGRERRVAQDEKEKEPAWMDTYVPSEPLPGILGGKSSIGELDGIQAWKKGMKEKEIQEKEKSSAADGTTDEQNIQRPPQSETQLDEIQLFRLMMQKEKDKRNDQQQPSSDAPSTSTAVEGIHGPDKAKPPVELDSVTSAGNDDSKVVLDSSQGPNLSPQEQTKTEPPNFAGHITSPSNDAQFVPPQGSRLLALGRGSMKAVTTSNVPMHAPVPLEANSFQASLHPHSQPSRSGVGFSPFEEQSSQLRVSMEVNVPPNPSNNLDSQRMQMDRSPLNLQYSSTSQDSHLVDLNSNGHTTVKGSRFAKFFDGKTRETPAVSAKSQSPIGFSAASPNLGQRLDQVNYTGTPGSQEERRRVEDLFAMLSSSQTHSGMHNPPTVGGLPLSQQNVGFNGHHHVPPTHQQQHHSLNPNRMESLYDSRLEDRSFVPNDMVPGLRTFPPPPRTRETYPDSIDDPVLHLQRLSQQHQQLQQRAEPPFSSPGNGLYNQQSHRSLPVQQQYRANPNQSHTVVQNPQRFPPGLANLGNRPPHEPSQFLGLPVGTPIGGLSNSGPLAQQFSNFNNHNGQYNAPPFRGGLPPINLQGLQQSAPHVPLGNVAQANMDPRLQNQHFNTGLGVGTGIGGGHPRVPNNIAMQQRLGPHPQLNLRAQQQQQQIHPQLLGHMHPSNPPSQQHMNQPAQDLMALLMGGTLRE